jgi:hypothetical protein
MTPLRQRMIDDMRLAGFAEEDPGRLHPGGPPASGPLHALARCAQ